MVAGVGNVKITGLVHRHARGKEESRHGRLAAVPAVARFPGTGDGVDSPRGIHPADALAVVLGDVDIAGLVHRHSYRKVHLRLARPPAVPGVTRLTGPRDGVDFPAVFCLRPGCCRQECPANEEFEQKSHRMLHGADFPFKQGIILSFMVEPRPGSRTLTSHC